MPAIAAKITAKAQITIPRLIRERLDVAPGDTLLFEVIDGAVHVLKAPPTDIAYLGAVQATLSEWDSPEDEEAYADLQSL